MLSRVTSLSNNSDRLCTYDVILRRVRVTVVAVNKQDIAYCDPMYVAVIIQHAKRMRLIVMCGLSGSSIFFYIIL